MLQEFQRDVGEGSLYISPRLSPVGRSVYQNLLRDALDSGSPESFAAALDSPRYFNPTETRETPGGHKGRARVPTTAAVTLAEGEFNRFYIRGLCRRALREGVDRLIVYRAKLVDEPRSESQQHVGVEVDPLTLLSDLRSNIETTSGAPMGPNSGLSVRLPT
ncbi:MAG: hypothetical protein H6819_04675 [Phycisphaerales bacterium]|nr:hypothetical protein [Phycisphaerales bacterium]MCB9856495.1 hypothetical protein [Phycisphaerales bacterium]MCB9863976.1 hypothetical protein [Phycisphaerales bacterium]